MILMGYIFISSQLDDSNEFVLKKVSSWLNTTIPIQTIVFINEQLYIYGRHIDDVITSCRRGFEMG